MKSKIAAGLLLALCFSANAQFIDERGGSNAVPKNASSGSAATFSASPTGVAGVVESQPSPIGQFDVKDSDQNIREVISRWAVSARWTHKPEHWAIDRDLPVSGVDDAESFGPDFKIAVRRLLTSTELTDRPSQPCFYTNRVVRVIPAAELCDKTNQ